MAKNSDIQLQEIHISASIINKSIAEMLNEQEYAMVNREDTEEFITQFNVIKSAFRSAPAIELRKIDIATRLSLIDLFYTTNFNRFAEFGLEELTEALWNLCTDLQGFHSDAILVNKTEVFVSDCHRDPVKARESEIFLNLFTSSAKFGVTKIGAKSLGYSAQSLISKYLFFLLESHHSDGNYLGFPIFDSIALDLQVPLLKKLGGKTARKKDMVGYIENMTNILNCLKYAPDPNSSVWNMPHSVCNTQFGLLDYFLWRIGKSGKFSFSLLWTKDEKINHYDATSHLKNKTSEDSQKDFQSLPERFKQWHMLYSSIKGR